MRASVTEPNREKSVIKFSCIYESGRLYIYKFDDLKFSGIAPALGGANASVLVDPSDPRVITRFILDYRTVSRWTGVADMVEPDS